MNRGSGVILIVDDDADFQESLSSFLEAHGYAALRAYDGRRGAALAKSERPDLIIMDIMMDERTEGFFTIQEIRRTPELAKVPVFVVSALYAATQDFAISPGRDWMAHDEFFPKPINMDELLEKIQARLSERSERANEELQRSQET